MIRPAKKQKVERRPLEWEHTDAMLWDPRQLVGQHLRVLWPGENRYFPGTVNRYDPETFQHEVHYDDGDEEKLILSVEKIQLLPACVTKLSPPSPSHLGGLARHLDALADALEVKAVQQRTARGRTMLNEEDRRKLELLRRRSAEVRSAKDRLEAMLGPPLQQRNDDARQNRQLSSPSARIRACGRSPCRSKATMAPLVAGLFCTEAAVPPKPSPARRRSAVAQPKAAAGTAAVPRAAAETVSHPASTQHGTLRGPIGDPGVGCHSTLGERARSPKSSKRRGRFLIKDQQGKGHVVPPNTVAQQECVAAPALSMDASPFPSSSLMAASLDPRAWEQQSLPGVAAVSLAVRGRGKRAADSAAGSDIGRLYVPRPWPILRAMARIRGVASAAPATAPAATGEEAPDSDDHRQGQADRGEGGAARAEGRTVPISVACGSKDSGVPACDGDGGGAGAAADDRRLADASTLELQEAYKHFRLSCFGFKQYRELQVALWASPEDLVGREIRVFWPDEQAWFCGRVTQMDAAAGTHTVEYDDGDVEHLHLAAEEVRLQLVPGETETLAPRPPEGLQRVAVCMAAGASRLQQRAQEVRTQQSRPGRKQKAKEDVPAAAVVEDAEELVTKAERLSTRAAELQSLAMVIQREAARRRPAEGACALIRRDPGQPPLQAGQGPQPGAEARAPSRGTLPVAPDAAAGAAAVGESDGTAGEGTSEPDQVTARAAAGESSVFEAEAMDVDGGGQDRAGGASASVRDGVALPSQAAEAAGGAAEASLPADWAERQVLRPGEVVWAQVRGMRPWPAIVITREEAEREGLSMARVGGAAQLVFVRFFGDCTVCALPPVHGDQRIPDRGGVAPFLPGVELGWHVPKRNDRAGGQAAGAQGTVSAQTQRFLRALFELRTYMRDGELPRGMIPPNYDDDDDEDEAVAGGLGGSAAAAGRKIAAGANSFAITAGVTAANVSLPLSVNSKLQILRLGEVVWLSRWFHDEKYIYPLGYCAARVMASGASGGKEVRHVLEVAASEDSVRPVFRITPDGGPAMSADTASRAMRALFQDDARASGRAFAKTGADLFGLSNQRVAALVRSLPGAERCEFFANWPDQEKPPVPSLTPLEEVQRRALYARSLRLPADVATVPQAKAGMCFECEVCGEDEECAEDLKLECDLCRCVVHAWCYGVQQPPHGDMWLCDVCQLHAAGLPADCTPPCELCPVSGGPMKRTEAGGFAHLLCALWTPGITFGDLDMLEPVQGVAKAVQARLSLRCSVCKQGYGACIQCAGGARCYTAFHPMCAREAGVAMCELRSAGVGRNPSEARRLKQQRQSAGVAGAGGAVPADEGQDPQQSRSGSSDPAGGTDCDPELGKENIPGSANGADAGEHPPSDDVPGGKLSATAAEAELAAQGAASGREGPKAGAGMEDSSKPVSLGTAAVAAAVAVPCPARRGGRGGRGRPPRAAADPGACLGMVLERKGIMLACFCQRHEEIVLRAPRFRTAFTGGRFAERRAELTREQLRLRRQQLLQDHELNQRQPQAAPEPQTTEPPAVEPLTRAGESGPHIAPPAASDLVATRPCGDPSGSDGDRAAAGADVRAGSETDPEPSTGRAMSFADWRSRGHRAPEAVAIAREKRTYMQQLPYLVTGRLRTDDAALEVVRAECRVRVFGPDGLERERDRGLRFRQQQHVSQAQETAGSVTAPPPAPGCGSGSEVVAAATCGKEGPAAAVGGSSGAGWLPTQLATAAAAAGARSVAERYAAMRATVARRVAVGKSAIHGWGAFAKVPHKRGDMVIEYVGELIRPTVSDVREKRVYDTLVGCGTYIFNLNDQQHIDATRSGNMAHLLNHSCDPNCYSRTITLWDTTASTTRDHVIIIAKRDIKLWEELTYDYRFNSAVDLPCNCGAVSCRLLVNWPEEQHEEAHGHDGPIVDGE